MIVALQIIEGKVDLDSFVAPPSKAVLALAARIEWSKLEPHFFPQRFEASMTVGLRDGRVLEAYQPDVLGNASRPATDAMILDKFRANAKRALQPIGVDALQDFWFSYDKAVDFSALTHALTVRVKG